MNPKTRSWMTTQTDRNQYDNLAVCDVCGRRRQVQLHSGRQFQKIRQYAVRCLRGSLRTLPDFLIIGVAKAGTTSLYRMVAEHPQVMPAERKEVDFFWTITYTYPLSRLWYRSHFPNVLYKRYLSKLHSRRMVTGESSPFYLTNHHAPGRIKTTLPDAKLMVILRNPVDRAYSDYHMSVRQHRQSMTFEDAVRHGYTAQAGHADLYRGRYAEHMGDHRRRLREQTTGYLSRGHYAEHLTRWFEHFDRDRFLILTLDELKADPRGGGAIARVFEFLGLDPFDVKPQDRGPQNPAVKYGRMAKDGNVYNVGTYPKMNPDTRKTLVDYYRPHNRRLSVLLKRDFDWDR